MHNNFEEAADEVLTNFKNLIGNQSKVAESLADLSSAVMYKVENMPNEQRDLVKAISSQSSVEGVTWFFIVAYSKMLEGRDKLKGDPLNKKEPELWGFEDSQSLQVTNDVKISKWLRTRTNAEH